eukprot:s2393_g10.t1
MERNRRFFTYRARTFRTPDLPDSAAKTRYSAVLTFLQHQPEIETQQISIGDFEFLWHAAQLSFQHAPSMDRLMNIPLQRVYYPPNHRINWSRKDVPLAHYFNEVFVFLRRKAILSSLPTLDAARALLLQPCDMQIHTCTYANNIWFCFVPDSNKTFFEELLAVLQRTACYQQEIWSQTAWENLWETVQIAACAQDTTASIQISRQYQGQRWRRRIAPHQLVVAAELQHYLNSRPVMSLNAFSHCFDTCILHPASQWDYWCTSSADRLAALSSAASKTALEPQFYASDLQSTAPVAALHPDIRARHLAAAAQNWPNKISTESLLHHLQTYRSHFETVLHPPDVCAVCACPSWRSEPDMLDLRDLPCSISALHTLLSAQSFLQQYAVKDFPHPATFVGLTFEHLQPHFVPLPLELRTSSPAPCIHRNTWTQQADDPSSPLHCVVCPTCSPHLQAVAPKLPPQALANNNACIPPPAELRSLSLGEQMFIARGFAVRRLRTLTKSGDPEARQRGILGTASAIAFPQNTAPVLFSLPAAPDYVADYLSIFFTDATQSNLHLCKEFVVRRSAVHSALLWLLHHNPYYADITIDLATLQTLPDEAVPDAWVHRACLSSVPLTREFGPADASTSQTAGDAIHAAVLDPGTDHNDPVQLWNTALLACERHERHVGHQPDAAYTDIQLAQYALHRLADTATHNSFERDSIHQNPTRHRPQKVYLAIPHSDTPLDSYDPSFWSVCFPVLFPFGDGLDGQPRRQYLTDHDWGALLLRRRDRSSEAHWRLDLDFVSVLFSVLHRRRLLRAVRVRVQAPSFREQIPSLTTLRAVDWTDVATTVGEQGSLQDALRSTDVPQNMKHLLRLLQTVQGQVPCTDAARRIMRGELASLTTYFGYPLLFVTLNPADVLHPFTWRHALSTSTEPLPELSLDEHLLQALQSAHLWKLVAQDPTAAVEAFHTHVNAFLQTLLDVPSSSQHLPADGIASRHGNGIFGPLSAIFGSIEPQQRGSLHIHFLLFCYGFHSPQSLIQQFSANLQHLEARLWSWIRSIVVTAFEAIPSIFGLPTSSLQQLRPLPYSDANMMLMHPTKQQHLRDSTDHWFAALPQGLLPAHPPAEHPFRLHLPPNKTFLPWCLDYVHTLQHPMQPHSGHVLLYDLRTSILHSGLLHTCQSRTCYKGKLGKRGYCRLGFWHWLQIGPRTWERCHGVELAPRPLLGTFPPHVDTFQTERHHQFFGRVNPIILAACKCNHDVSTLLRFPANYQHDPNPAALITQRMSSNMATLLFYVTCYTTKTQPHLSSLWALLQTATHKLQDDSSVADGTADLKARAKTTLSRLLLACQKRVHKSMQEMVSYLLGHKDAYCTHTFHKLFFFHLAARLESAHPLAGSHLASVASHMSSSLFIQPNQMETTDDSNPGTKKASPSFWSPSSDDYPFRGEDLQGWPLYFYAAGVTRVAVTKSTLTTPGCIPFAQHHPQGHLSRQLVLTNTPWRIPHLMGPRIPPSDEDPEKRALLLLLLFKPWMHLQELLPQHHGFLTWSQHFDAWLRTLQAATLPDTTRAATFTPAYWAQRTLHIITHLDNAAQADPSTADRELRCNPDELHGVPNTTTIETDLPPDGLDTDSSEDEDPESNAHDLSSDAFPMGATCLFASAFLIHSFPLSFLALAYDSAAPASARSSPAFTATLDVLRSLSRSELLPPLAANASFVTLFRVLNDAVVSNLTLPEPCQATIYRGWPLPSHLSLQQLQRDEMLWDFVSTSAEASSHLPPDVPSVHLPSVPKTETVVFQHVTSLLQSGRFNISENSLNLKQAAYLLLVAAWLQCTLNRLWGFTQNPPPFQTSLLLGGPGTGKTFISHCVIELLHFFLPASTLTAAYTHRAARLINGRTLHACLALPFDSANAPAAAASLGHQKDALELMWRTISTFLIDEASMLSNELLAFMDLRCRQIRNVAAIAWGGLATRFSGDFHQLPPVGATCLIQPLSSNRALAPTAVPSTSQCRATMGAELWQTISTVIILNHSHRCGGPLQTLLDNLSSDRGLTFASWQQLQARLLTASDARLLLPKFQPQTCPVGVMRHSIRALQTLQRAEQAATAAGHRLLLSIAADRCSFAGRHVFFDPALAQEAASVHTLSATANLQLVLALYPGAELCLESKLCVDLGVVRGCTVVVEDILLANNEPHLAPKPLDEYWIACLVLLSRVRSMDDLLLLRMPDYAALNRPRPEYLQKAYATFQAHEQATLQQLDRYLAQRHLDHLRDLVTQPLLQPTACASPPLRMPRRRQNARCIGFLSQAEDVSADQVLEDGRVLAALEKRFEDRGKDAAPAVQVVQETEERAEDMEEGHLSLRVWCTFMRAMGCGAFWVIVLNLVSTVGYLASALWLGHWPEVQAKMGTGDALAIYAVIAFGILFFTLGRILMFQWSSLALAISMHKKALWAVLRAPMSWLDTTPGGRIINRFSSDMSKIDLDLQGSMQNLLRAVCDLFASVVVAGAVLPIVFIIFVPVLFAYHWIQKVYRKAGREIQRLASKARSPIYQGVDEAIVGVTTIRAYDKQGYFMAQNERRVSRSLRLDFTQMGCQKWLGFRLKMLGSIVSTFVALLVVLHRYLGPLGRAISGPAAGLALRYAQQLSNAMEGILNNLTMAEQCLVAVERLNTYMEMEDEGSLESSDSLQPGWLADGSVRFENVVMRYREGTPLVLKGLSFEIPGGSSLGIVGRTGAGKSSLLQVLFRMCPLESGAVYLDGHDTSKMGLHTLRKSLAIIPQDPVGFTGTVRFNLDPFNQHTDHAIWQELEKVQLKTYFEGQEGQLQFLVAAGGENLSVGQRQLLCCARALIRGTRILVLDEATASVDFTTDSLIQNILRTEVKTKHLTTLTIAHRIQTVLGGDRVLVVADGQAAEFGPTEELRNNPQSMFYTFVQSASALVATSLDPFDHYGKYPLVSHTVTPNTAALLSLRATGADFQNIKVRNLSEPIRFSLLVDPNREAFCAYWDEEENRWSDKGMETLWRDDTGRLMCASYHLTLFGAVLGGFIDALLCSQATLLSGESVRAVFGTAWYREKDAKLFWIAILLQSLLMILACACDHRPSRRGAWLDENFVTTNPHRAKASLQYARTRAKTTLTGRVNIDRQNARYLAGGIGSGFCSSLKETAMNFLDVIGSTCEASFSYMRNFVVCAWETSWELLWPSEGNNRKATIRRLMARMVASSIEYQACASMWLSLEDVRFLLEEDQLAATGARPSTPSTRASASKADTVSVESVEGEELRLSEVKIKVLHRLDKEQLTQQHEMLMQSDGRGSFLAKTAARLFLSQAPWLTVLHRSIFISSSLSTVLLLCRISGALAVTALFWQNSAAGNSELCRKDMDMWDTLGKCIAVALATLLLASIPEMLLSKLHIREFVKVDEEDMSRVVRRWRCRDKVLWVSSVSYITFCLMFVTSFLANVNPKDVRDWEISATIEICTDLILVPSFMTILFLAVTGISVRCWKDVVEESAEHIGCGDSMEQQFSIVPRPRQRSQIKSTETLPALLRKMESEDVWQQKAASLAKFRAVVHSDFCGTWRITTKSQLPKSE